MSKLFRAIEVLLVVIKIVVKLFFDKPGKEKNIEQIISESMGQITQLRQALLSN